MKKNILKKVSIGITLGLALLPFLALAYIEPTIETPGQITHIIERILVWFAGIVMTVSLIMLLWAAILYMTAGGAEDKVSRAKNYLIYAVVGIAVAILAYSVAPFLITILGGNF